MTPMPNLLNLTSVLGAYLRFRRRGLVLVPTLFALPLFFVVAELLLVPGTAGTATFRDEYSNFFQTAAAVIASLLVVVAVELKFASRESRLATGEAGVIAVAWIGLAEVASVVALSPAIPLALDRWVFSLTVSGGVAGLVAVMLIAARGVAE
jgi:hypothetical protein